MVKYDRFLLEAEMLKVLEKAERDLPELLQDRNSWKGLYVDYEKPFVERLWRQWGDYRINLHSIHPCNLGEALFHPHPWPQVIRVISGRYEMGLGYGAGMEKPPVLCKLSFDAVARSGDFIYEMTDPNGWHYVRPITQVSSIMITGKPWNRSSPRSEKPLRELTQEEREKMFTDFQNWYPIELSLHDRWALGLEHMCGMAGFGEGIGDACPACEKDSKRTK